MKVLLSKIKCMFGLHKWEVPDRLGYKQHGKRLCLICNKKQSAIFSSIDGVKWFTTYKGD